MTLYNVTIQVPPTIFQRIQQRSQQRNTTVSEEVAKSFLENETQRLPENLSAELKLLDVLSDEALWLTARTKANPNDEERMQALFDIRNESGWTKAQEAEALQLSKAFNRIMLIRAKSAATLKRRGYDVSSLGPRDMQRG